LFATLDKNGDGVISAEELREALANSEEISDEDLDQMVQAADINGDGKISKSELKEVDLDGDGIISEPELNHFRKSRMGMNGVPQEELLFPGQKTPIDHSLDGCSDAALTAAHATCKQATSSFWPKYECLVTVCNGGVAA